MEQHQKFPREVSKRLLTYVYRLIDPRNGETFYVGKGKGDRVFAHIRGKRDSEGNEDELDSKMERIREIKLASFEVGHVIHRHGMNNATALEVESALLDAYPGLTNAASGVGNDRGAMHADEIRAQYKADLANFRDTKAVLISVNRSALEVDLYEATRFAWAISNTRATEAEVILPVVHRVIRGAFVADKWLQAIPEHFPGRPSRPDRYGFVRREAPQEVVERYEGKRVPDKYKFQGNPIRYTW